ncbi:MAG: hypothetical protein QOI34_879 [Verrucomicrobiota bacterium]
MAKVEHSRFRSGRVCPAGFLLWLGSPCRWQIVETRLLVLNADPVFQDATLAILEIMEAVETRIARTLSESIAILLGENFDGFLVEGEAAIAVEQAVNARQHFPSLKIACVAPDRSAQETVAIAEQQDISLISASGTRLSRSLRSFVRSVEGLASTPAEGIDPCHSLIGNLNQFSAPEILQMSCLSQRSGRFTFKSGRGNSEIYLQQGAVRHAVYGSLEGESAVAEIFRWRQGRFYFEEGIISQEQTVNRPWAHLLIDNLQKLDETLELVSV